MPPLVKPTPKGAQKDIKVTWPGELYERLRLYTIYSGASSDAVTLAAFERLCEADTDFAPWVEANAAKYASKKRGGARPKKESAAA
jgi:hypothetical protein